MSRARATDALAVLQLFVDDEGLWTTARLAGSPPSPRPAPTSHGLASRDAWRLLVDGELPGRLVELARGRDADERTLRLLELVAAAVEAARGPLVPRRGVDGAWQWQATPGPHEAAALAAAVVAAATAGAALVPEPEERCRTIAADVVAAVTGDVDGLPPDAEQQSWGPVRRQRAHNAWADRVAGRRAANARLALRLDEPEGDGWWSLSAVAIALDPDTTRLPLRAADAATFGTTPALLARWRDDELAALDRAWPGATLDVELPAEQVLELLDVRAPALQDAGIDLLAPAGLLRPVPLRRRARASSAGTPAGLGLAQLLLDIGVEVDGERLTEREVARLARAKSDLVRVRGRWMRIGSRERTRLARLLARTRQPLTLAQLVTDEDLDAVELELPDEPGWQRLHPAERVPVPDGVLATLRPYQRDGLDWLAWLEANGAGGVLADDMGLGKTLQVLSRIATDSAGPTLVVCPVTLVDTWQREATTFVPGLSVAAYHGATREDVATLVARCDVVVTTYGLLARDEALRQQQWHRVVLDEAQAIKNPDTRTARAARALTARHRLAVTGTPVENHLGDLWSLLAFAAPGLLPRRAEFHRRFVTSTPEAGVLHRLHQATAPFVLRRAKTDPGVAPDLPPRVAVRDDCALTREQVGAYEAAVAAMLADVDRETGSIEDAAGVARTPTGGLARRGAVLAGIARLKQICVHPALITERRTGLAGRSGKVERLVELAQEILDERQAVVVFTQFASFVPDLAVHLEQRLGVGVLTLTGADSRVRRSEVVQRFGEAGGPPVLLASLKAGGTGLTLTRANHVVHLDRWWNPAVEDQASDRVWRIGQTQHVVVHTLVCPGTLEERIDAVLATKRDLAATVVRSSEAAITELTRDELTALVQLSRERVLA